MEWFDQSKLFYTEPSGTNEIPEIIPASWFAACMLYHIQATEINCLHLGETLSSTAYPYSRESKWETFGYATYPTTCLINRSFNPNVGLEISENGVAFVYALEPLKSGSEIRMTCRPPFYKAPTHKGLRTRSRCYFLQGKCIFCSTDWSIQTNELVDKVLCARCREHQQQQGHLSNTQSKSCPECRDFESSLWHPINASKNRPYVETYLTRPSSVRLRPRKRHFLSSAIEVTGRCLSHLTILLKNPSFTVQQYKHHYVDLMFAKYGLRSIEPWVIGKFQIYFPPFS